MYRIKQNQLEVFLVHPGGPYFVNKDDGYWGIPKGQIETEEDLLATAKREFEEETGIKPDGHFLPLGFIKQKSGKKVHAWAFLCERIEDHSIESNLFEMEWPPNSGKIESFPEVDLGEFFPLDMARQKIGKSQEEFLDRLEFHLRDSKLIE